MSEKNYYRTTESILYNFRSLETSIEVAESELENLEQELKGMYIELNDYDRDCNGTGSGSFSGGISNVTEKKILRKERLKNEIIPKKEKEIDRKIERINRDKTRIENIKKAINNLEIVNSDAKRIIELFFVKRNRVEYICQKVNLEQAQVHRLKSKGIKAIKNQLFGFDALEEEHNLISMLK